MFNAKHFVMMMMMMMMMLMTMKIAAVDNVSVTVVYCRRGVLAECQLG